MRIKSMDGFLREKICTRKRVPSEMRYAIMLLLSFAILQPAEASRPVRKTIIGCVTDGVFTSEDGYVIRIRQCRSGRPLDLSGWQNKRLQVTGDLLPADNFFLVTRPVVLGRCR